jgi:uncharacterized coiled-coil DUF342 family protein
MSVFNNFTKKVSETAKAAAKKSGDIVEMTKINMSIGAEEDKIKKAYAEIGKKIYELSASGAEIPESVKEQCDAINTYESTIEELKQKILEYKNIKVCASCGTELDLETVFCPKCGAKQ